MILVSLENVTKYAYVVAQFFLHSEYPSGTLRSKKFQTMLILVFEVIVQPPKAHFLTFSSETKIMKITHSEAYTEDLLGHSLIEKQDGTHFRWFATR